MLKFPSIWYVYCFAEINEKNAYERLKVSISSIPEQLSVKIITWHYDLENKLAFDFPGRNFFVLNSKVIKFSKSFFINQLCKFENNKNAKYIYLADIDLFFHPEYFFWLNYIMKELSYEESDIRIVSKNFNVRARPKVKLLPGRLYGKCSYYFPKLYDWDIPKNFQEILSREMSKSDFAHGCGLIPLKALQKIGGYNSELVGHGPEDDLFNQRIKFYSRIYYHKGSFRSATFHLPHPAMNQKNRFKNHKYWFDSLDDINRNGIYSQLVSIENNAD